MSDEAAGAAAVEIIKTLYDLSYFDEAVEFSDRLQATDYVEPIIQRHTAEKDAEIERFVELVSELQEWKETHFIAGEILKKGKEENERLKQQVAVITESTAPDLRLARAVIHNFKQQQLAEATEGENH